MWLHYCFWSRVYSLQCCLWVPAYWCSTVSPLQTPAVPSLLPVWLSWKETEVRENILSPSQLGQVILRSQSVLLGKCGEGTRWKQCRRSSYSTLQNAPKPHIAWTQHSLKLSIFLQLVMCMHSVLRMCQSDVQRDCQIANAKCTADALLPVRVCPTPQPTIAIAAAVYIR